jgi:hypothetical protein
MKKELRSLKDLTKHLTARADDSHATPVYTYYSYKEYFYTKIIIKIKLLLVYIQKLVRFCAYYRIKPHAPPLV